MSDFVKTTNFTAKDALTTGDPNKVIKGTQFDTEFDALATSSATKSNKVVSGTTSAVMVQDAGGDISDSGYIFSNLSGTVTATTAEVNKLTTVAGNGEIDAFPTGTEMIFYNTAAPTGWTKSTANTNKAMRVVSSTGGTAGGTVDFTTAFASQSVAGTNTGTSLSIAQMPAHTHTASVRAATANGNEFSGATTSGVEGTGTTNSTGSGTTHTHTFSGTAIDMDVQYLNVIVGIKD